MDRETDLGNLLIVEQQEIREIKRRVNALCESHGLEDAAVLYLVRRCSTSVPIEIFSGEQAPLQALVMYLHESEDLRFCEIARRLSRDQRAIWVTYSQARRSRPSPIPTTSRLLIPVAALCHRKASILESLVGYLIMKGFSVSDISSVLDRDTSTIWTALRRARAKGVAR